MEINDQGYLDFGTGDSFPVGGQISPSAVAEAQVDKTEMTKSNELSPTRIAETSANQAKIKSDSGESVSSFSVANEPNIDFLKYDFAEYDETEEATDERLNSPIKVEVNQLTPAVAASAAAEPPKPAEIPASNYKVEGTKAQNEDGTFKLSLKLRDLISNVIISDSLVVNEKTLDVAYSKAVEELKGPLARRANMDDEAKAVLSNINLGKIEIPGPDELNSPRAKMVTESVAKPEELTLTSNAKPAVLTPTSAVNAESIKSITGEMVSGSAIVRAESIKGIDLAKSMNFVKELERESTPTVISKVTPTPANISNAITETAQSTQPESEEYAFASLLGSELLGNGPIGEEFASESSVKFNDLDILSAMFGTSEPEVLKPALTSAPEIRVESSKSLPNKSVINEIVNPPNPVVPALEGLGQTITSSSSSMTDTLAGKMESAFSTPSNNGAVQTLANNVTNITNSQSPQGAEQMSQAPTAIETSKTASQGSGGGMSEYYLRAIYEALVVQGIKLRTI